VLPRLGVALLLASISTATLRLLRGAAGDPSTWMSSCYVRWLVPPALILFWCAVLLPREAHRLYRAARSHPAWAPVLALLVLLGAAAAVTSGTDLAFEWGGISTRLKRDLVLPNAWATNVVILFAAYAVIFAASSRVGVALLVVTPAYLLLNIATLAKIKYMHSALQPLDVLRLPELAPLFVRFFGIRALALAVVGLGLWIAGLAVVRRHVPTRMSAVQRVALGAGALALLLAFPLGFYLAPTHPRVQTLLGRLGAPDLQYRDEVRRNGLLLSFLSEARVAFVQRPPGYSRAGVIGALRAHARDDVAQRPATPRHVDLILYVVESLMDPDDLGVHFTSDPIPNIRSLRKAQIGGYAIVPERFGGSANTEFEALTGMSMSFLPVGSLPYRQYIRRPLPSLARTLRDLGFATTAVQADAKYYYNRERVYDLLGFQRVIWVNDLAHVERADRPGWPSDRAVVSSVIEASRGRHPFFAFAFPSSTHSPYSQRVYRDSPLDVVDPPVSDRVEELKEYINAIRVADEAIGSLIEYFRSQPDSTIIAVLGDHVAPLSADALSPFFARLAGLSDAERDRRMRRVPLLVWANFPLPREDAELSVNALPSYLLARMGIPVSGFAAVTDEVRLTVPVVGSYLQGPAGEVWRWDSLPASPRVLLESYRLLQYDLLLGKQYALSAGR
jgi:hypothetical protein